jgi:hypothetical protein
LANGTNIISTCIDYSSRYRIWIDEITARHSISKQQ